MNGHERGAQGLPKEALKPPTLAQQLDHAIEETQRRLDQVKKVRQLLSDNPHFEEFMMEALKAIRA